jgi:hypothetical protein
MDFKTMNTKKIGRELEEAWISHVNDKLGFPAEAPPIEWDLYRGIDLLVKLRIGGQVGVMGVQVKTSAFGAVGEASKCHKEKGLFAPILVGQPEADGADILHMAREGLWINPALHRPQEEACLKVAKEVAFWRDRRPWFWFPVAA